MRARAVSRAAEAEREREGADGGLARERVDRLTYQMDFPAPLGQLAQVATLAIFAVTAAVQVGVSADILIMVIAILLAAAAAAPAWATSLGDASAGHICTHD